MNKDGKEMNLKIGEQREEGEKEKRMKVINQSIKDG